MSDRHEKWVRVEPGTVIPAGQPYRVEYTIGGANETRGRDYGEGYVVPDDPERYTHFVDSSWRPPLNLPTEPASVIEARTETDAVNVFMFLLDRDAVSGALDRFWVDVTGFHWDESEIVSARTVYDAGVER